MRTAFRLTVPALTALAVLFAARPLASQQADDNGAGAATMSYHDAFAAARALTPRPDRSAMVNGLVLERAGARFALDSGELYLLTPINAHTVGAAFKGLGTFSFAPSNTVERERLFTILGERALDVPIRGLVMLFSDSTAQELEHRLTFAERAPPGDLRGMIRDGLDYISDEDGEQFEPDIMREFLNSGATGLFYAHVVPRDDRPLMFMVDPYDREAVSLSRRSKAPRAGKTREVVCQFAAHSDGVSPRTGDRVGEAAITHYDLETWLPRNTFGEVRFIARAGITITGPTGLGPWVPFWLYSELEVDSARWADGSPATAIKEKDNPILWVRFPAPLTTDAAPSLNVFYHGDLIDRFADFFLIKSSAAWYPRSLEFLNPATFDLTFHSSTSYSLVSIGEPVGSDTANNVITSRWRVSTPTRNASFNMGLFERYDLAAGQGPKVAVLFSDAGHREIARRVGYPGKPGNVKEDVGGDVAGSLEFFDHVYGAPAVKQFYATEILDAHGEAFPGLVHLWAGTFGSTAKSGFDEVFRAHEVAHQWWGIGVDFSTYHDQWLSEGLAEFSALWYLQTVRKNNKLYFDQLEEWKKQLLEVRKPPGEPQLVAPVALGYRAATSERPGDYDLIVYRKGAWVIHMIRILMLDLRTVKEDAFTGMMRAYYGAHRGGVASTASFRAAVERQLGADLGWFFDEWVYGTAIPTYRVAYRAEPVAGGKWRVRLRVRQENVPDDFRMLVPYSIDFGDNRSARLRVDVRGPVTEVELPLFPLEPKGLRFNELEGVLAEVKMEKW
jgi:hypothetical protein